MNKTLRSVIAAALASWSFVLFAQTTLKDAFKNSFLVGAAVNRAQISGEDSRGIKLIESQFNSITPENMLKWTLVHPQPNVFDFRAADGYVEFGERHRMVVIGHTLIWHKQTPNWVFEDEKGNPVTRDLLLKRMRDHIHTVVGRYQGRIHGWDVVNEALNEDGTMRQSPWMTIIGADYVEKAFQFAHEADPKAELYYNDYSLENEAKRKGAVALLNKLMKAGIPVTAVGLQGHDTLDWPTPQQQDESIVAFEKLGVNVNITELDITVLPRVTKEPAAEPNPNAENTPALNPYPNGLPDSVQQALAKRYADLFALFLKHQKAIRRVTFWGVTDADSWRNNWPVRGRTDYPLLFDRRGVEKPAFEAVIRTAQAK
ncbi:MAG: 1,4-beta-xylanase [Acidobacteria bacterium]|nr:MAG: 1,4-beta-xylanase [Acidobacteriota bacterium]PYY09998.1 MAG: 1,4-beta-xylanase [Acidobacteriota bacterium]